MVSGAPTSLAPGFRFHPTDEELVRYYLRRKVCGMPFRFDAISEIDIYKAEPWDLPGNSKLKTRDLEWYFFCAQDKKYGNGSRSNRGTGKGYWKTTGKDRAVSHGSQAVGMKKTLVYHSGRAPRGERTNWVMHEYRLIDVDLAKAGIVQDAFVLCRVFQKSGLGPKNGEQYGAPFVEEEWVDDGLDIMQKVEAVDEVEVGENAYSDENDFKQERQLMIWPMVMNKDWAAMSTTSLLQDRGKAPLLLENVYETQEITLTCKRERSDDLEPLSLGLTKRSKEDDPNSSHANGSEDSTTTSQDPASKIMTKKNSSGLLEFPLLESVEPKAIQSSNPPTFDSSNPEAFVPPGYLKFICNLENEMLDASMERETLKIEVMRAQAIINILQSRIDLLSKENEDLRRFVRGG